MAAIRLTVVSSLAVGVINAVMGTLIAWVLVRDAFPGKRVVEVVIDIPFALPTIVAGLVLLTLYGQQSPIGLDWFATRPGVLVALLFVTLPFVVRTVQPVLLALDARGGGGRGVTRRRAVHDVPADRAADDPAGDRGRVGARVRPGDGRVRVGAAHLRRAAQRTSVASQYVYGQIQDDEFAERRRGRRRCCC